MSPVSSTETSRHRSSITIESSFRTLCRSQSGTSGCRTTTSTSSNTVRSPVLTLTHVDANRLRLGSQRAQRLERRHHNPLPHLARPKLANHRRGAADVIGIAVGQHDGVEPPDARGSQHRRDHAVADVEARPGQPAGVHEHGGAARKAHERGVALPDVEKRHVQPAVAPPRDERPWLRRRSRSPRRPPRQSPPDGDADGATRGPTRQSPRSRRRPPTSSAGPHETTERARTATRSALRTRPAARDMRQPPEHARRRGARPATRARAPSRQPARSPSAESPRSSTPDRRTSRARRPARRRAAGSARWPLKRPAWTPPARAQAARSACADMGSDATEWRAWRRR